MVSWIEPKYRSQLGQFVAHWRNGPRWAAGPGSKIFRAKWAVLGKVRKGIDEGEKKSIDVSQLRRACHRQLINRFFPPSSSACVRITCLRCTKISARSSVSWAYRETRRITSRRSSFWREQRGSGVNASLVRLLLAAGGRGECLLSQARMAAGFRLVHSSNCVPSDFSTWHGRYLPSRLQTGGPIRFFINHVLFYIAQSPSKLPSYLDPKQRRMRKLKILLLSISMEGSSNLWWSSRQLGRGLEKWDRQESRRKESKVVTKINVVFHIWVTFSDK